MFVCVYIYIYVWPEPWKLFLATGSWDRPKGGGSVPTRVVGTQSRLKISANIASQRKTYWEESRQLPDGVRTDGVFAEVPQFAISCCHTCLDQIDTWTERPFKGFTANARCYLNALQTNFNPRATWPSQLDRCRHHARLDRCNNSHY